MAVMALQAAVRSKVSPDEFLWSPILRGAVWHKASAILFALPQRRLEFGAVSASAAISTSHSSWQWAQSLLRSLAEVKQRLNLVIFNAAGTAAGSNGAHWQMAVQHLKRLEHRFFVPDEVSFLAVFKSFQVTPQSWDIAFRLLLEDGFHYFQSKTVTAFLGGASRQWRFAILLQERLRKAGLENDPALQRGVLKTQGSVGQWRRVFKQLTVDPSDAVRASNGLSACVTARQWQQGLQLLEQLRRRWQCDLVCLHGAASCLRWPQALWLLRSSWKSRMQRDVVGFGTLMSAAESEWPLTLSCLQEMSYHKVSTSRVARNAALGAVGSTSSSTSSKMSTWRRAVQLFGMEEQPGEVTFRALLAALEENGEEARALQLLWEADSAGVVKSSSFYLWAFARLTISDPECLADALQFALRGLKSSTCVPQELSTLLWSSSSLGASNEQFTQLIAEQALHQLSGFSLGDLLFLTLGACDLLTESVVSAAAVDLGRELEKEMLRRFQRFEAPKSLNPGSLKAESAALAEDMLGVVWALNLAQMGTTLYAAASRAMRRLAHRLDGQSDLQQPAIAKVNETVTLQLSNDQPELHPLGDRLLILKPCGWETAGAMEDAKQLPQHLQALGFDRPVLRDQQHQCGFIHRLDVPSSGLLLCGLTYQAYYNLKLQLSTGRIRRDYLVLCHGFLSDRHYIRARVTWKDADPGPSRCGRGKPSITFLRREASAWLPGYQASTLLDISLGTGRRHQIRSHLAFIGHAVVCDSKYCADETFRQDAPLCPQNCLHRYGLALLEGSEARSFAAPLPEAFGALLQELEGKAPSDAEVLKRHTCACTNQ